MGVDDLVRACTRQRPEFNVTTAEKLKALVEQHDDAGRFQIEDGWLRKVPHEERQPRETSMAPQSEGTPDDGLYRDSTGAIIPGRAVTVVPGGPEPPGDKPSKFWQVFK